jgi:C4-type Zn-finger protein
VNGAAARTTSNVACPFCGSEDVELVSPWAGQLITSQLRCRCCNTYFEAIRDAAADADR